MDNRDAPGPPETGGTPLAVREILAMIVALGAFVAGGLWWTSSRFATDSRSSLKNARNSESARSAQFVGSRVCAECHPGESALQSRSGHSRTLRRAWKIDLAEWLNGRTVEDPEAAGVNWTYAATDDGLSVVRQEGQASRRLEIEYAFGSGHHAVTFVSLAEPGSERGGSLEHRLSYFAQAKRLDLTPGQRAESQASGNSEWGRHWEAAETLKCFGCHTTWMSDRKEASLDAATMIPNVTCESCHGPAGAHVAAARRGESVLTMPFGPEQWTADSQMKLCGRCHRLPEFVPSAELVPTNPALVRFQPVGLMQSRCYKESAGALSCVNCHDPHARSSTDTARYEAVCLSCHEAKPRTICPVSPRAGCIACHMPRRVSGHDMTFSDHWIRIPSPSEKP